MLVVMGMNIRIKVSQLIIHLYALHQTFNLYALHRTFHRGKISIILSEDNNLVLF